MTLTSFTKTEAVAYVFHTSSQRLSQKQRQLRASDHSSLAKAHMLPSTGGVQPLALGLPPRQRLRGKQAAPNAAAKLQLAGRVVADALDAERGADDEKPLPHTVKRQHVHYTHVRTFDAKHVQPRAMAREDLWQHLERVCKEV